MVRPRQFSDDDLLTVARACFIEHGPAVSTAAIAQAAGVSQATLFKRFGTKQELMREALRPRPPAALMARLAAGPDERPVEDQLHELAAAMVEMFDALLPCVMTLWAAGDDPKSLMPSGTPPPVHARMMLTRFFSIVQDQGRMRTADPEAMAMAFIGAVKELAFQRNLFPDNAPALSNPDYARALVTAFWQGCAPPEAP